MELYGVHHGGDYSFGGYRLGKLNVYPSPKILDRICELPPNSRIGLEVVPESLTSEDQGGFAFHDEDIDYWQRIIEVCESTGHEIIYLDNFDLHKASALRRKAVVDLQNTIEGGGYTVVEGKERELTEITFAYGVVAQYIFEVERENFIIDRLTETQPDLAIIGMAHGDYLMLNPDMAAGANIEAYWRGTIDDSKISDRMLLASEGRWPIDQNVEKSPPDESTVKEREQLVRVYQAVTIGRITLGEAPEFIGSWDTNCRPRGLFEVHTSGNGSTSKAGSIEDMLGTAIFEGDFNEDRIWFVKEYDPAKVLDPSAVKGEVTYEAERTVDNQYEGEWSVQGGSGGEFVIRRGGILYEPFNTNFGQEKLF